MAITAFVPNWTATPEMAKLAARRRSLTSYIGSFRGYEIQFSPTQS